MKNFAADFLKPSILKGSIYVVLFIDRVINGRLNMACVCVLIKLFVYF